MTERADVVDSLRALVDAGSYEEARAALLAFDSRGLADAEAHLELAGIAERTGELERLQRPGRRSPGASEGEREPASVTEIVPDDADCVHFATLFAGREGVYARQWTSPTGKHGYAPVEEPFTPVVARQHLLGAFTAGFYPPRMDNTVPFLAFDLDIARFALSREAKEARGVERVLKQAQVAACQLVDAAASLDLACLIEDSGWKGAGRCL